jgi:tetratricopeptide (TPR) repeat protein
LPWLAATIGGRIACGILQSFLGGMVRLRGILAFGFLSLVLCAQVSRVRVWQDSITLPTYRERPPDAVPPFDQLALAGTGNRSVYPYTLRLNMTSEKYNASWRVLNLENEYLHCRILPDQGGHLYTCRDKLSGADMFYANSAMKKGDLAPRGAWIAGGIETSFPIAHSRLTVSPVNFATATHEDGSATVFVGARDRVSGMEWRVAYTLHPGSTVLEEKVWLSNPGYVRQPFQWWSNAAIRLPDGGLQLTYPMWVTAPHGAGVLDSWPVNAARIDLSNTARFAGDLGLFAYGSREPFFAEYNARSRTGVAHWAAPQELPGKKIWVWGNRNEGYKDRLSDDHSGYIEIQAGLETTQEMMEFLEPQQSRSFTELWIPTRDTGGISRATRDAVVFLERKPQPGGSVKAAIDLNVTRLAPHARLTVTKGDRIVYQQDADLDPAAAFHAETPSVSAAGKFRVELKDASGQVMLAHQEDTYDAVRPTEVKIGGPVNPAPGGRTPEQEALAAGEQDELIRLLDRAARGYRAALSAAPQSLALRRAAGRFSITLGRWAEALESLTEVHKEDPSDGEVTYYLGVARSESGDDSAARRLWQSVPGDSRFGLAAQYQLACATARAGDRKTAVETMHALAAHGAGHAAGLEIALLRRLGRTADAQAALAQHLAANPMDSLLRVEGTLLGREDSAIWLHLAADPEWVLDLADDYFAIGLYEDAIALLDRGYPQVAELETEPGAVSPNAYPLIAYYRGYARARLGQSPAGDFRRASGQLALYVHPYHASSYPVLRAAIEHQPVDYTAHYLLGCLLFNRRMTEEALAEWQKARPAAEGIASYYGTVARVLIGAQKNDLAEGLIREALTRHPDDGDFKQLLASVVKGSGGSRPAAPPPASFSTPAEAANFALTLLAANDLNGAANVFQEKNFPEEKQPAEVRQAYAEWQLRALVSAASSGDCADLDVRIDDFAPENKALPFTFYGFGGWAKQPRMQFYFGLAEWLCGDKKAASKRWSRIAKASAPLSSPDHGFPLLAASLTNPAGSSRAIETALEGIRTSGGSTDKSLLLYSEGILLRADGREEEAFKCFAEGAKSESPFARYLNRSVQYDPPLPR